MTKECKDPGPCILLLDDCEIMHDLVGEILSRLGIAEVLSALDGEQGLRAYKPDVPHVADIEDPNTVAYGIVFGNDAAAGRIFNGHVPPIEFDHLGAHLAMHGI